MVVSKVGIGRQWVAVDGYENAGSESPSHPLRVAGMFVTLDSTGIIAVVYFHTMAVKRSHDALYQNSSLPGSPNDFIICEHCNGAYEVFLVDRFALCEGALYLEPPLLRPAPPRCWTVIQGISIG